MIPHQTRNTATAAFRAHVPKSPFLCRSQNRFDDLVSSLSNSLGPSSGLTTAGTDILQLSEMMTSYKSAEPDWIRYAFADYSRGYTRNLVDEGNGKANLVRASGRYRLGKTDVRAADLGLESGKGQSHPQSCGCPLSYEGRGPTGMVLLRPFVLTTARSSKDV